MLCCFLRSWVIPFGNGGSAVTGCVVCSRLLHPFFEIDYLSMFSPSCNCFPNPSYVRSSLALLKLSLALVLTVVLVCRYRIEYSKDSAGFTLFVNTGTTALVATVINLIPGSQYE